MVTRHERGSTAGSGGLQEGFRLCADAMDRRDAPERSARRAAVAVCSTVGLLVYWARIKTDLLLKRPADFHAQRRGPVFVAASGLSATSVSFWAVPMPCQPAYERVRA